MSTTETPTPAVIPDIAAPAVIAATPKVPKDTRHTTIAHCCFRRPSLTTITGTDPIDGSVVLYHVGQIALYCLTDARLRKSKPPHHGLPAGYEQFMALFNAWTDDQQTKRFASYDAVLNEYDLTGDPINLADFNISHDLIGWSITPAFTKRKDAPLAASNSLTPKRMKIVDGLLWKVAENAAEEEKKAVKLRFKKNRKPTSHPFSSTSNFKKPGDDSSPGASAIAV
jgi:hypothetical protein